MRRVRLTNTFRYANYLEMTNKIASNYGNFKGNLLKLYPRLSEDAKRYDFEGKLMGSGFVIHHLDKNSLHYIPSCVSYTKLIEDLYRSDDRESYCKRLNRLLSLKSFIKENDVNAAKEKFMTDYNLSEQDFKKKCGQLSKLDAEVNGIVLLPRKFHDYLHVKDRTGESKLPKTKDECWKRYLEYLKEAATEKKIRVYEKKIETLRGQIETIVEIASLLRPTKRADLMEKLEPVCTFLIDTLRSTNSGTKQ